MTSTFWMSGWQVWRVEWRRRLMWPAASLWIYPISRDLTTIPSLVSCTASVRCSGWWGCNVQERLVSDFSSETNKEEQVVECKAQDEDKLLDKRTDMTLTWHWHDMTSLTHDLISIFPFLSLSFIFAVARSIYLLFFFQFYTQNISKKNMWIVLLEQEKIN